MAEQHKHAHNNKQYMQPYAIVVVFILFVTIISLSLIALVVCVVVLDSLLSFLSKYAKESIVGSFSRWRLVRDNDMHLLASNHQYCHDGTR